MATTTGGLSGELRVGGAALLADRWMMIVLRGVAAVIFGILTFIAPGASLLALVVLFGAYALVNGVINLGLAARGRRGEARWGSLGFESGASIVAGMLTLLWPGITALLLLFLIAGWAIATGVAQVIAAVRLRKQIRGEWLLALTGVLSVAFGVLLLLFPGAGALAVVIWIGAYALVFGALLIALGLRLRSWGRSSTRTREAPPGALPVR
ncbi:MAG TPA: HdeD family acid-resistance protein [Anaeromyxobacter sp.]